MVDPEQKDLSKRLTLGLIDGQRITLTRARFRLVDTMVKYGNFIYHLIRRQYVYYMPQIEDVIHIIFDCQVYVSARAYHLNSVIDLTAYRDPSNKLIFLTCSKIQRQKKECHVYS